MDELIGERHKTVTVEVGRWRAEVDELIAPLVRELWIAGISTTMSCQGEVQGTVWIAFDDAAMLASFLNVVAEFDADPNSLYNRICRQFPVDDEDRVWEFGLLPDDTAFCPEDPGGENPKQAVPGAPTDVFLLMSVWFPRSDLELVLQRVRRYNRHSLPSASLGFPARRFKAPRREPGEPYEDRVCRDSHAVLASGRKCDLKTGCRSCLVDRTLSWNPAHRRLDSSRRQSYHLPHN